VRRPGERHVAITGATGFVGRHLVARMAADGWAVDALVIPGEEGYFAHHVGKVTAYTLDGSTETVCRIMTSVSPDAVVHLASLFVAEHAPGDVEALVQANILFGTQVLEGMTTAGCGQLVNVGTSWQHFGGAGYEPVCLYAATKQAFEDIAAYHVSAVGLRIITLKLFDTYGPDDARAKLVPKLIALARDGGSLALSPGHQLLDMAYVDDVVEALAYALERLGAPASGPTIGSSESFAVSGGQQMTLREFIGLFERVCERRLDIDWGGRPYRAREVMVPWSSGQPLPGWTPKVDLAEGLRRTVSAAGLLRR